MAFAIEDLNGNEAVLITRYGPSYQNYVSAYGSASAGAYGSASSFAGSYPHGVSISSAFPGTYATSFASSYPSSYNYGSYPSYNRKVYGNTIEDQLNIICILILKLEFIL